MTGASVSVRRGHVEVADQRNHTHVTIGVGQTASVDKIKTAGQIDVTGKGKLPDVLDAKGKPVPPRNEAPKGRPDKPDKPDKPAGPSKGPGKHGPSDPPGPPSGGPEDEGGPDDDGPGNSGPGGHGHSGPGGGGPGGRPGPSH